MLEGRTALITGANRGIGKVVAEEFARCGADIIAHARCETFEFLNWCESLSSSARVKVLPVFFDMTDSEKMRQAIRHIISAKIPLNVLVNNAGIAHGGLFQMTSMSTIRKVFDVNLFAQMELTQLLLRPMSRQKKASIINMGSVLGLDMPRGSCAYGLSKAALMAFTSTLAAECASYSIRVNALAPSLVDTDMANLMEEGAERDMMAQCAMGRRANPLEIARTAAFLASEYSSYINGQVIRVDGGKL